MTALKSRLFASDDKLQACAVSDPAHLVLGTHGDHVSKVHTALLILDEAHVASAELKAKLYGPTTEKAVLAYKTKRQIINKTYQSKPDAIVGKMTIARMDSELCQVELRDERPLDRHSHLFT